MAYYSEKDDLSYTPLTFDEEGRLFAVFYAGGEEGDKARETLILSHLKLTAKLALRFAKRALDDDFAISAGNDGLMQAIDCRKFRPVRGVRFSSYIQQFVRGKVVAAMRANGTVHESAGRDRDEFFAEFAEDCALTGMLSDLQFVSYTQKRFPEDFVEHEFEEIDLNRFRSVLLDEALAKLNPTEKEAVEQTVLNGRSFQDTGTSLGISRQAVEQAYKRGLRKLRKLLEPKSDLLCP